MPLDEVPNVDIDPEGTFKYILIKCTDKKTNDSKLIVRGYGKCTFHADILDETKNSTSINFKLKCLGGGRIKHDPEIKDLFVYGYSQGFGQADHKMTTDILKSSYKDYSVAFSNEGY